MSFHVGAGEENEGECPFRDQQPLLEGTGLNGRHRDGERTRGTKVGWGPNDRFFTQGWVPVADGQSVGDAPVAVVPVLTGL